jgi:hypothetical protein
MYNPFRLFFLFILRFGEISFCSTGLTFMRSLLDLHEARGWLTYRYFFLLLIAFRFSFLRVGFLLPR